MKAHLSYHNEKNMYIADGRSPRGAVIKAYFDYLMAIGPVNEINLDELQLLQYSASLLRKWNNKCPESSMALLKKQNRPILVRVLTRKGPEYWAKSMTRNCIRHSAKIYYTSRFADLFLSMLLTNEARVGTSVDALYIHFSSARQTTSLFPKWVQFWRDLTRNITSHSVFKAKV